MSDTRKQIKKKNQHHFSVTSPFTNSEPPLFLHHIYHSTQDHHYLHHLDKASQIPCHHQKPQICTIKQSKPLLRLVSFLQSLRETNATDLFISLRYAKPKNSVSIFDLMRRHARNKIFGHRSTRYMRSLRFAVD